MKAAAQEMARLLFAIEQAIEAAVEFEAKVNHLGTLHDYYLHDLNRIKHAVRQWQRAA